MPRHTVATRANTMDARVFALEITIANPPTMLAEEVNYSVYSVISNAFTTQLSLALKHHIPMYFEQFRCEVAARGGGESSSASGFTNFHLPVIWTKSSSLVAQIRVVVANHIDHHGLFVLISLTSLRVTTYWLGYIRLISFLHSITLLMLIRYS